MSDSEEEYKLPKKDLPSAPQGAPSPADRPGAQHPGLIAITRALDAFEMAFLKEEQSSWREWIICNFESADYDRAFAQVKEEPWTMAASSPQALAKAERYLDEAEREFGRTGKGRGGPAERDMYEMFMEEKRAYRGRKWEREEAEAANEDKQ